MMDHGESLDPDLRDPLLERLADGVALDAGHRRQLVDRLAPVGAPQAVPAEAASRPRTRRLWWWAAPAVAAAAVVLVVLTIGPSRSEPVSPVDVLGAFFGPLPALAEPAEPMAERPEPSYVTDALTYVWGDLEGLVAVARQAALAPRALTSNEPSVPAAAGGPEAPKED